MEIEFADQPVDELRRLIDLFARRHDVLRGELPLTAFRTLLDAPPEIDVEIDRVLAVARAQLDDAAARGEPVVALRVPLDEGVERLVHWSAVRFEFARSLTPEALMPDEWRRVLDLYSRLLADAVEQVHATGPR